MKKRICALILSCMVAFTGMPVSAAEDTTEEIIIDSDADFVDYESPETETVEDGLESDSDLEEWLQRYNLTMNEDGDYQSIDEEGQVWTYYSDDPELYKYFPREETEQDSIPLLLPEDGDYSFLSGGNTDPHVFKLNPSRKYSYPKYYKTDDDSKRVDIHYGIDISSYQKNVSLESFQRMKNEYGIEFVFIRAGLRGWGDAGNMKPDDCFANNAQNAAAAGLKVGAYFFSQATSEDEAREEAEYCDDLIEPYKNILKLPVIIDYEYSGDPGRLRKAGLTPEQHTAIVNRFCSVMRSKGYSAGIYANKSMLAQDMVLSDINSSNYIWMANYVEPNSAGIYETSYSGRLEAWQFTSSFTGFPSGMVGTANVDFDFWFGPFSRVSDQLKYDANGGTGKTAATKGYTEQDVTVAKCGFTNAGHEFVKWNTAADGSGDSYQPGNKYTLTEGEDLLYAIWEIQYYTLTFDSRGGSSVDSVTAVYDSLIGEPKAPVLKDYIFTGWYKDAACTLLWDFENDRLRRDTVLYAGWKLEEKLDWGDLDLPENADIKALYESPDQAPLEIMVYDVEKSVSYTGKPVTFPGIRVFYGKKQLRPATDYTVKYKNNTNAGTARLIITGKGNYDSTRTVEFEIAPLEITGKVMAPDIRLSYTGKVQKGKTDVSYIKEDGSGTTLLTAGKDYDYSYQGDLKGRADEDTDYIVTVIGKGNYKGTATFTETILKKQTEQIPVSKLKVKAIKAQKLALDEEGKLQSAEPLLTVTYKKAPVALSEEDGYVIEKYTDNDRAGTASVYIRGTGRFTGTARFTFKVSAIPMKNVKVEGISPQKDFTGSPVTQEGNYRLTYTSPEGRTFELREGEHFEVSYLNNIKAGKKASVVFTGIGAFGGTSKKSFTINKVSLGSGTVKSPEITVGLEKIQYYSMGGVKPQVSLEYNKDDVSYKLVKGKDYSLKYANNTAVTGAGSKASVTITGKGSFKGSIKEEFEIKPENLGILKVTASDVVYKYKKNICKTTVTITDLQGKKLAVGTDFSKKIQYTYAQAVEVNGEIRNEGDFVLSTDIVPPGTRIKATVIGIGNFQGEGSAIFRFVGTSIAGAKVKIADQYYTGRPVYLDKDDIISVTLGKELILPENYEIVPGSYVNNINKGTASVTLRGVGDYGGTVTATFKIAPKSITTK
ncbi:GH25 family lysozyme [Butyrivibrio sp. MC2021]|uniref:GH25 family lysozyme n=1 Tax=Butyrivibrio sp. MC2021 TaxID=1408306 RepID=UPI0009DD877D|nr:GH25 family lysozyme [Butyrivibrio sp. MC2021]